MSLERIPAVILRLFGSNVALQRFIDQRSDLLLTLQILFLQILSILSLQIRLSVMIIAVDIFSCDLARDAQSDRIIMASSFPADKTNLKKFKEISVRRRCFGYPFPMRKKNVPILADTVERQEDLAAPFPNCIFQKLRASSYHFISFQCRCRMIWRSMSNVIMHIIISL